MNSESDTGYLVELTARASLDLEDLYAYIDAEDSPAAARWYNRLEHLVDSLHHLPSRGAHVTESPSLLQLLHDNKPHLYRVIYSVEQSTRRVVVVHIRSRSLQAAALCPRMLEQRSPVLLHPASLP